MNTRLNCSETMCHQIFEYTITYKITKTDFQSCFVRFRFLS
jgi:hypothetical protein